MDSKYDKQMESLINRVEKLLDLDNDEKQIVKASLSMAKNIGANQAGEKMNRELRKANMEMVKDE